MRKIVLFLCSVMLFIGVLRGQPQNISLIQPEGPICLSSPTPITLSAFDMFNCSSPDGYIVQSIPYDTLILFNQGTSLNFIADDIYSTLLPIFFNFCFYDISYDSLVVGSNGIVSFNKQYANQYCPWSITDDCPSHTLPRNSIFGVYHDIDFAQCGQAKYKIEGTAPFRKFIVSMNDVCHYSCSSLSSTHQIVLYETYNIVDVTVKEKPICAIWNAGRSIIGIQDTTGLVGITPPNRNTNPTWQATNETWRFIPCFTNSAEYEWYENGIFISDSSAIQVLPTQTTTYSLIVSFFDCNGQLIILADSCVVSIQSTYDQITPNHSEICRGDSVILTAPLGSDYLWSPPTSNTQTIVAKPTESTVYSVTLTDPYGCTLISNATVDVNPDVNITLTSQSLISNQVSADSYQWIDCDNNFNPLPGQVFQEFFPPYYGSFAVIVEYNGCVDTSDCVLFTNIIDFENFEKILLYPNPTNGTLFIKIYPNMVNDLCEYQIINSKGSTVLYAKLLPEQNIDISFLEQGLYIIRIQLKDKVYYNKFVLINDF